MPSEVFEDSLDITIGLIEAVLPESGSPSLPFPVLTPRSDTDIRSFGVVLLENAYLRVTVVPGLGGRILSIFDKRTNCEILPSPTHLQPLSGSRRGAFLPHGVQLRTDGEDRLNSLGYIDYQLVEAPEEEDPAGVWIGECASGTSISFHLLIELPAESAEIRLEARVFNRSLQPAIYDGGLSLFVDGDSSGGSWAYSSARDAGLAVLSEDLGFGFVESGRLLCKRFAQPKQMAPRQLDTWRATLVPLSGLGSVGAVSEHGAMSFGDGTLRVQAVSPQLGGKVILLTADGQSLEAPVDLYPEVVSEIPLPMTPKAVVWMNAHKDELLRYELGAEILPLSEFVLEPLETPAVVPLSFSSTRKELLAATIDVSLRGLAHALLGYQALARGDARSADACFEQSLLYNAEDHLVWWAKAIAQRMFSEADGERAELLNAHYLAPLEPALRAEGFLSQQQTMGKEPNPLLKSLEDRPENFVEVACLLVEARLFAEATRWIDESLRHLDLAMLRYLQAYCYLTGSRMEVEAAEQVAAASRLAFEAPLPYRAIEREALRVLVERFPSDERIKLLLQIVNRL